MKNLEHRGLHIVEPPTIDEPLRQSLKKQEEAKSGENKIKLNYLLKKD